MRLKNIFILMAILLALGGAFYFVSRPQPVSEPKPRLFVWLIEMEEIQHINIQLPREGESQAFIKEADRSWHFDDQYRSPVNMELWGAGIPLLLSGPGVDRIIKENASPEELAKFGLAQPQMEIILTLESGEILNVLIGDTAPDGHALYVKAPASNDVALVDYTWYFVLENLVSEPPYGNNIMIFHSPSCNCCGIYTAYLSDQGFQVGTDTTSDMPSIWEEYQIPEDMLSCHTAIIEGYFVEGHVPVEAIKKLLEETPDIDGISLPGMPSGSPGMPGLQTEAFIIYAVSGGETSEFMVISAD